MRNGFSLVEVSLVLVIFGLLAGAVLVGQSLMRSAELNGAAEELEKYTGAVRTFKTIYAGLPGDLPNATNYWGAIAGTGSDETCFATPSPLTSPTPTCNGNGDGIIAIQNTTFSAGHIYDSESARAWQHLVDAGLIEGTYNGILDTGCKLELSGPESRLTGAGESMGYAYPGQATPFFPSQQGNTLFLGKCAAWLTRQNALTPGEAHNIDTKIDDGKPTLGRMTTEMDNSQSCYTATHSDCVAQNAACAAATYPVDTDLKVCALRMLLR